MSAINPPWSPSSLAMPGYVQLSLAISGHNLNTRTRQQGTSPENTRETTASHCQSLPVTAQAPRCPFDCQVVSNPGLTPGLNAPHFTLCAFLGRNRFIGASLVHHIPHPPEPNAISTPIICHPSAITFSSDSRYGSHSSLLFPV